MSAYQDWLDSLTPFRKAYIETHNPAETYEAFNAGLEAAAKLADEADIIYDEGAAIRALKESDT